MRVRLWSGRMRRRPFSLLAALVAAVLVVTLLSVVTAPVSAGAPATSGSTVTIGTLDGVPTLDCGTATCTALQVSGPATTLVPVAGTLSRLRVRHGAIAGGGLMTTDGTVLVLSRTGTSYTVVRSARVTFAPTSSTDSTSTFGLSLPVAAGDYVALQVTGADAESRPSFLATGGADDVAAVHAGAHAAGTIAYAERPQQRALVSLDITTAGGSGGGSGGGGAGGAGGPGTDGSGQDGASCGAPARMAPDAAASRTELPVPTRRPAPRWSKRVVGRADRMMDVQLGYDRGGRPHVAARGATGYAVHYFGPGGARTLDRTIDQNDGVGMSFGTDGRPVVVWGERKPTTVAGRVVYCPRLHLAVPGGTTQLLRALPESTRSAFLHPEVERVGSQLHLAYDVNGRLVHHRLDQVPVSLPVQGVRRIRMASHGDRLLLGATTGSGRLTVFERSGDRPFRVLARATKVHDFDVAYAGRKPVVAWSGGTVRRLTVLTDGRRIGTRTPAEAVALATDGSLTHVVFSTVAHTTCGVMGCLHSGVYHVGLRGRRIVARPSVVQRGASSPFRLAAATHRGLLGVAMSRNGVTTLHQRRF